jgi:hypothetical protein
MSDQDPEDIPGEGLAARSPAAFPQRIMDRLKGALLPWRDRRPRLSAQELEDLRSFAETIREKSEKLGD